MSRIIRNARRLFNVGLTKGSGNLLCPSCSSKRLKYKDTLGGGTFPRKLYVCRDCGQPVAQDARPANHFGDVENVASHMGKMYAGETRLNRVHPDILRKGKMEVKVQ